MRALFLLVLLVAAPEEEPLRKVDRTKVVGAPVLDAKTNEGIYVWLEDGWFHVAAVARTPGEKKPVTITFRSTKTIEKPEGFGAKAAGRGLTMSAEVGEVPIRGRFKTEGEVTVNTSQPLFVGPLSKKAKAPVSIGRY